MSDEKMMAAQTAIKANPELEAEVKGATSIRQFVEILQRHGIEIGQAELMKSQAERILKLSDAELESAHINAAFYSTDTFAGCVTWALTCTCSATSC